MTISPTTLTVLYFIVLFIALLVSVGLIYHWKRYGVNKRAITIITVSYISVLVALFIFAAVFLRAS
jgi:hypothetical protein